MANDKWKLLSPLDSESVGSSRSGMAITTSTEYLWEGAVKAKDEMKLSFDIVANK
jgi:hypothetical protein